MNKRRFIGVAAFAVTSVVLGIACRQQQPDGDPKTPANRPIPEIDRKEQDPKTPPPAPGVGDGG